MKYFSKISTIEELKNKYRQYVVIMHPDKGGSEADFKEMQAEYERAALLLDGNAQQQAAASKRGKKKEEKSRPHYDFSILKIRIYEIFKDAKLRADYDDNEGATRYESFADWFPGNLAPLNRAAFIEVFGLQAVNLAEKSAELRIKQEQEEFENSQYMQIRREAEKNGSSRPTVGNYYITYSSGITSCGYIRTELRSLLDSDDNNNNVVFVGDVLTIDAATLADPEKLIQVLKQFIEERGESLPHGVECVEGYGEKEYIVINAFAVVCGDKWFFVDSEGYDYPKYILMPSKFLMMYAEEIAAIKEQQAKEKREEEEKEAREAAERRAEYDARCARWWSLMQDVRPLQEAADAIPYAYGNTPGAKTYKAAKRKLQNARRANIIAMVHAVFPGLKVSVTHNHGWGADYTLEWTDGPTEDEVTEKLDLDLFCSAWDTFDGMTDCADRAHAEFTEFAKYTMGSDVDGNIKVNRVIANETRNKYLNELCELVGASNGDYKCNEEDFARIVERFGADVVGSPERKEIWDFYHNIIGNTSLYNAPEESQTTHKQKQQEQPQAAPAADTTTEQPQESPAADSSDSEEAAPADGLSLVDIPGGVAVVGSSRDTFKNRKEIKAHGAAWNKEAQQWQATAPEDVARLRAWFGSVESEQPQEQPQEEQQPQEQPQEEPQPQEQPKEEGHADNATEFRVSVADLFCYEVAVIFDALRNTMAIVSQNWQELQQSQQPKAGDYDTVQAEAREMVEEWRKRIEGGNIDTVCKTLGEICAFLAHLSPDLANVFNFYGMGFYSGDFRANLRAHVAALRAFLTSLGSNSATYAALLEGVAA